jgi:hypothetical protein
LLNARGRDDSCRRPGSTPHFNHRGLNIHSRAIDVRLRKSGFA